MPRHAGEGERSDIGGGIVCLVMQGRERGWGHGHLFQDIEISLHY